MVSEKKKTHMVRVYHVLSLEIGFFLYEAWSIG
jgi:hypothetical protein